MTTGSAPAFSRRETWTAGIFAGARVVVVAGVELAAFYLLPLNSDRQVTPLALGVIALALLLLIGGLQVAAISRSPLPAVRAVEALAAFITLLLVVFAATYYMLSSSSTTNFTQAMTRTDALYFTTTVFSTVGFGDIAPVSEPARTVVTIQMLFDLAVVVVGLRIIVGAVKLGRERRGHGPSTSADPAPSLRS
jgi:hypothetical protein